MQTIDCSRISVSEYGGKVLPAIYLTRLVQLSRPACELMGTAQRLTQSQPLRASETVRELIQFVRDRVEETPNQAEAIRYLERWANLLEDRWTGQQLLGAVEHAHLQRPIAKQTQMVNPLGVRNPGAVVRGRRHFSD